MVKTQPVKGKLLKKSWHNILATKSFDSALLGETYLADPQSMVNSRLTVNLANLTGDIRQQGISLKFKISEITDGKGVANVIGYEASSSQLRRLVRRGVKRLDDSIECKTSDGKLLKVKPFAVTRAAASKVKMSLMRKKLREAIAIEVAKLTFDELVKSVISHNLQNALKSSIRKIFPLRAIEIRKLQLSLSEPTAEAKISIKKTEKATPAVTEKTEEKAVEKKTEPKEADKKQ
ncbi:hypothetical protein CMO88_04615 [Candidatus Woesearchaeota archaeon]|nr:hypothetical protein [Candidatus Woesearchaeota archaeon]|tara:strand:- start:8214 stop:8915 length:702 start_codon:yes stop_codon:yes gene_type:complete